MRLPQEIFAEELWLKWLCGEVITSSKILNLLKKNNLKLKKEKTLTDMQLLLGRAFKNCPTSSTNQINRIAEEVDKICIISDWGHAKCKYDKKIK